MSPENWLKGVEALVSLLQSLAWPAVFLIAISYFREPLRGLIADISEFTLKAGGVEASVKRQQIEAGILVAAAAEKAAPPPAGDGTAAEPVPATARAVIEERVREIAHVVSEAVTLTATRRFREASILWVDDRPANNTLERRSFEALGINVTTSASTDDAVEKLRQRTYSAIVSDMGRPLDPRAGYTLLNRVRNELKLATPVFIYAGSSAPEHRDEALRQGAQGSTNRPQELFQMVTGAIKGK